MIETLQYEIEHFQFVWKGTVENRCSGFSYEWSWQALDGNGRWSPVQPLELHAAIEAGYLIGSDKFSVSDGGIMKSIDLTTDPKTVTMTSHVDGTQLVVTLRRANKPHPDATQARSVAPKLVKPEMTWLYWAEQDQTWCNFSPSFARRVEIEFRKGTVVFTSSGTTIDFAHLTAETARVNEFTPPFQTRIYREFGFIWTHHECTKFPSRINAKLNKEYRAGRVRVGPIEVTYDAVPYSSVVVDFEQHQVTLIGRVEQKAKLSASYDGHLIRLEEKRMKLIETRDEICAKVNHIKKSTPRTRRKKSPRADRDLESINDQLQFTQQQIDTIDRLLKQMKKVIQRFDAFETE